MMMQAVVLEVQWERLLVLDLETRQRVLVNTPQARWFSPGSLVRIWYNGAMTNSIPPQIFAQGITAAPQGPFPPAVLPPVILPPVVLPPVVRPPARPPLRPPWGRPPSRPGRPGGPGRPR